MFRASIKMIGGVIAMTTERNDDLPRYGLYIDGRWTDAADGATIPVNESALGRPIAYAANGGAEDVDRAVRAARTAFDSGPWPHTPIGSRQTKFQLTDGISVHGSGS